MTASITGATGAPPRRAAASHNLTAVATKHTQTTKKWILAEALKIKYMQVPPNEHLVQSFAILQTRDCSKPKKLRAQPPTRDCSNFVTSHTTALKT